MREERTAYLLGAVGAVKGVAKEIKPDTAGKAWAWILGAVTVYELTCPKGELLSEGVDRGIDRFPVALPVAIGYTALHLANKLPASLDLFYQGSQALKR